MSKNKIPNGGFPPIKYKYNNKKSIKKDIKKERFHATTPKNNINIKQILSSNIKKPILSINNNNNELEETSVFN